MQRSLVQKRLHQACAIALTVTRGIVACPTMMPLDWTAVCCAVSSGASNRGFSCDALHTESFAEGKWRAGVSVFAAGVRVADGLCTAAAGSKDIVAVAHGRGFRCGADASTWRTPHVCSLHLLLRILLNLVCGADCAPLLFTDTHESEIMRAQMTLLVARLRSRCIYRMPTTMPTAKPH
jgi:hypothetical protein